MKKLLALLALASLASPAFAGQQIKPTDIFGYPTIATGISGNATTATTATTTTGNSGTATKLQTARAFTLTGAVTGTCSFDGSAACNITTAAGTLTGYLLAANNLSDLVSASTARTNLGLGTAATQNTGTSGVGIVPTLDGANNWSAAQTIGITGGTAYTVTVQSEAAAQVMIARYSTNATSPSINLQKSRGGIGTSAAVVNGDALGRINFQAVGVAGGNPSILGAIITATVTETTPSLTAMGTQLTFGTSPAGTITPVTGLTIASTQAATFANSATAGTVFVSPNQSLGADTIASDAAATYTQVITANHTQYLNVAITANRTVTLPTVTNGYTFHYVRSVASTGAFTWSIGAVKSLSAGQWVDIQGIGGAWVETAFGSL